MYISNSNSACTIMYIYSNAPPHHHHHHCTAKCIKFAPLPPTFFGLYTTATMYMYTASSYYTYSVAPEVHFMNN